MSGELIFLLVILAIVAVTVTFLQMDKYRYRIRHFILTRLKFPGRTRKRKAQEAESPVLSIDTGDMTPEESKAELKRLQRLIEGQKQLAHDTDITHHLWGFYKSLAGHADPQSLEHFSHDGKWYDVKILHVSSANGQSRYEFELKGERYAFVDDEEQQSWRVNLKYFSLFLYDDADRCLIEIPMKTTVDGLGRKYSVASGGPKAFLPGSWVNDFIYVKLKQQRIRNQEIRDQKHQERLVEIEELKNRFGISD